MYIDYVSTVANLSYFNLQGLGRFEDKAFTRLPQADNLTQILLDVVMRQKDMVSNCTWKDEAIDCQEAFLPVLTENGFCYTFNTLLSLPNWEGSSEDRSAKYIFETDVKWTVSFIIDSEQQYKLYVYSHDILPGIDMYPLNVWDSNINVILFSAKETYTTDDARQLTIKQRKCVYEDEIKLDLDDKYSYWSCMSQCRMRFSMRHCRCVPFLYKQLPRYPVCDLNGLVCLSKHADELLTDLGCNCHLGCKNTVYEVEKLLQKEGPTTEIGFISWPMIKYKREVLFGWVDLLVSFGGIAGLFLGFSLLSAVELVYYFTLRAACMLYQDRHQLTTVLKNKEQPAIDLSLGLVKAETETLDYFNTDLRQMLNNRIKSNKTSKSSKKTKQLILPYLD